MAASVLLWLVNAPLILGGDSGGALTLCFIATVVLWLPLGD
jgi:hypothetical protein